jgi:hypothetical protein
MSSGSGRARDESDGIDHERLTYLFASRDFRLTDVSGEVIRPVVA